MEYIREDIRNLAQLPLFALGSQGAGRYQFVSDAAAAEAELRCAELARRAAEYCAGFRQAGIRPRDRILLLPPATEIALPALLGAIQAGCVPALLLPPMTAAEVASYPQRVQRACQLCGARTVVGASKLLRLLADSQLHCVALESLSLPGPAPATECAALDPSDEALVLLDGDSSQQLSARSLSHADVLAALDATRIGPADVLVSWLPLTHDAGLLAALLPLYSQCSAAFLPMTQFLRRPASWLRAISHARATVSWAPEQAYTLCVQRIRDEELAGLDLSSWRCLANSGEALSPAAHESFTQRFAAAGLRADAATLAPAIARGLEAPLSEGQKALWFLAQLTPDSLAYNMSFALRIRSPLDRAAMRATLDAVLARHPALRTTFGTRAGVPYRRIDAASLEACEVVDASTWDDATLAQHVARETDRHFDLERGPLFVARLYVRGPADAVLLFASHHISVDGWSKVRMVTELAELYPRAASGQSLRAVPTPSHTYDDFVRWQTQLLAGAEGARLREYWSQQLAGTSCALAFPTDRPRPAMQSDRGAALRVDLPGPLVDALRALGKRHDATLYAVLLAIFQSLLHRITRQSDILVATPSLGRHGTAFVDIIGYFVNTLPIRARIAPDSSFTALLAQARNAALAALDHQDLPFANIVELARAPRDPSRPPLCQALFQLHTYRPGEDVIDVLQGLAAGRSARLGGLTIETYEIERKVAQFELALDLTDSGSVVSGRLEYSCELFDAATVQRWMDQFIELAWAVIRAPELPITSHTLAQGTELLPDERWNDTAVAYPDGRVHRAIEEQAARHPDAIAVSAAEQTLSYGELNLRCNRLARRLRELGAERDVLIGVCMDRSIELAGVLLAVMKAGAAYVPLDPSHPPDRLRAMIADAQPALIIADAQYGDLVQTDAVPILHSSAAWEIACSAALDGSDLPHEVSAADLAYVIYTSGSTGTPKGVGNTHAGLWNRLQWMQQYLELDPHDCVLQKTPYSFDVSVWEFFWPLMAGARLAIAAPGGHRDSRYLVDEIVRQGVTTIHFVPSMLEAFSMEPDLERCNGLTRLVCSGEALPYPVMMRCRQRLPGTRMYNLYGPTEASIDVTAWRCAPNPRGIVPIGRPIANTEIYILDEQRNPVAIGAVGELYIGGAGLARGYHRRPELTAERFVRHPFSSDPGARLYKTGDLARFDADGTIEYVGRNDDQIKLRGFRIELGEIEAVLRSHPTLRAAAVIARPTPADGSVLEAFVVADRASFEPKELRSWLLQKLPEYMVPSRILRVDSIPLTHSGKADRRALRELAQQPAAAAAREHVAPQTPVQQILAEVFRDVLGVREVSIHDNYFELGGDSIRSLQVRAMARQRGLSLEVAWLFTHQTIAELAALIGSAADHAAEEVLAPFALLAPSERATLDERYSDAYPATRLQLGMLYHSELTRDSWAYHDVISLELELGTPWQEHAMVGALRAVIERHPVLRSSFDAGTYSRPLQLIHRSIELPFRVCDLRGREAEASAVIREYIEQDKASGYDVAKAPQFRLMVHVLAAQRIRLTLGFHHAILDGWSTSTLLGELFSEYLRATAAPALPHFEAPVHPFSAFVALETQALAAESSRAYFARALDEMQVTRIPLWPRHSPQPGATRLIVPIDGELTTRLRELSAQQRAPLKALLMAAHVRTLAAFTGAQDVVTGWVVHGRPELAGAERMLGLFLNTLPARFQPLGLRWDELIAQVVRTEQELHPHRHFPLHEIQRLLDQQALFETAFNFVHFHQYEQLLAEGLLRVRDFESHENTGFAFMVNFVLHPGTGELALHLQYDTQRIVPEQATQVARGHVLALEQMLQDCAARSGARAVIDAPERAQLARLSRAETPAPALPLHVSFEHQAARTPSRTAVQCEGHALSYAALDGWANHIARRLIAAGARAGEAVSVCAEPSLQRMAAVLGVLKAGCACLPLDAEYPTDRLVYMRQRAAARLALVTHRHVGLPFLAQQQTLLIDEPATAPSPAVQVAAQDPAYIIFTSGSTGRPKGILMPHEPLANIVAWQLANNVIEPDAATAQFSLFGFDISFQEMFATWADGGTLVVVSERARKDARELAKLLAERRIARLCVPVVALHQLVEVADQLQLSFPELREINSAGEQLEITENIRAFFLRHPHCRLQNQYGPSETHIATSYLLAPDVASWPLTPPVGLPLPGVHAYVLDTAGQPAPIGVPGELFLAGPCVGLGYCNDPERTAERFTQDPESGHRMYQTGDLVRWLPDGNLEYCGRRDTQLKIRGFRVELGEVEAAIMAVSEGKLSRAAVLAVPGRAKSKRLELQAFVARAAGEAPDPVQLRAALARRLPSYMLPRTLQVLDALPVAPSGKLDRRALTALLEPAAAQTEGKEPPRSALETELCGLWQEVLVSQDASLGVTDDFFAHGGDSLGAVRLMARIQRRYAVELPISVLIEAPTVRGLARAIEAAGPATRSPSLIKLGGKGDRPPFFCVHPIGGHVLCYIPLARRLGDEQPFFGIQARGLNGDEQPHTSVVEMASAYAAEIMAAQPSGTLQVAGWSFGGAVALEIARRLRLAGRAVAPVVIIDSIARASATVNLSEDDLFEFVVMELFGVSLEDAEIESILGRKGPIDRSAQLARLLALVHERRALPLDTNLAQLEHVISVIRRNIQAIYDHRPQPYPGPVVLLRCTDKLPARLQRLHDLAGSTYRDPSNGWAEFCPQLQIIPVAGDHVSIVFEPHVAAVASVLRGIATDHSMPSAAQ